MHHAAYIPIKDIAPFPAVALPVPKSGAVCINLADEGGVVAQFINAVQYNPDDAWAFVSKMYSGSMDLQALRELFPGAQLCRRVSKAGIGGAGRFLTRSLYVDNAELNVRRLIHLRMVREPDKFSTWKICAVEQEDCPR